MLNTEVPGLGRNLKKSEPLGKLSHIDSKPYLDPLNSLVLSTYTCFSLFTLEYSRKFIMTEQQTIPTFKLVLGAFSSPIWLKISRSNAVFATCDRFSIHPRSRVRLSGNLSKPLLIICDFIV
jgi:hypothetical protein